MSQDIACHCGKRGALFAKDDHSLVRYHRCREHLDQERVTAEGLVDSTVPPAMPALFRDTEVSRLHPSIQKAVEWKPEGDKSGLLLHGTTGIGKTRAIWEIIRKQWVESAKRDRQLAYQFLTMRKIEGMIEKGFDDRQHARMLEGLIELPFLIIDDFGKERLTQRMASDLFAIIDERSTAKRPTIISTNYNGTTLLERFDSRDVETGKALIRRLKDYYQMAGMAEKKV
jgi:DNA replication protein DnaC